MANDRKFSFKPILYKNKYKLVKEQKPELSCYKLLIRPPSPIEKLFNSANVSNSENLDSIENNETKDKTKMKMKNYFQIPYRTVSAEN